MKDLLLVGLGGAIGAVSRYTLSGLVSHSLQLGRFPLGTLMVNVVGCFLVGAFWGISERTNLTAAEVRLFLVTGVLGGFTTFSAFGMESVELVRRQDWMGFGTYVVGSVVGGVVLAWLGLSLFRR